MSELPWGEMGGRGENDRSEHGTPKAPLTRDELVGKFESNAGLALTPDAVRRARAWPGVDQVPDIRQAMAAVAG